MREGRATGPGGSASGGRRRHRQRGMTNRMRRILLALTALAFMVPAAEAARRDESGRQQAASRPAQAQTSQVQRAKAPAAQRRATTARSQASRARHTTLRPGDVRTSRSGVAVRGASAATVSRDAVASNCTRRNGRRVCGQATHSIAGWQSGLPRADNAQTECPDGTFATLARGHDDVVRCMPL
jgi:hypothetical protein